MGQEKLLEIIELFVRFVELAHAGTSYFIDVIYKLFQNIYYIILMLKVSSMIFTYFSKCIFPIDIPL